MKKLRDGLYEYKGYQVEKLDARSGWNKNYADYNLWVVWLDNGDRFDYGFQTKREAKEAIDRVASSKPWCD